MFFFLYFFVSFCCLLFVVFVVVVATNHHSQMTSSLMFANKSLQRLTYCINWAISRAISVHGRVLPEHCVTISIAGLLSSYEECSSDAMIVMAIITIIATDGSILQDISIRSSRNVTKCSMIILFRLKIINFSQKKNIFLKKLKILIINIYYKYYYIL